MSRNQPGWLRRQFRRRPLPLWIVVCADILALGIALVIYALPHHVIPRTLQSKDVVIQRPGAAYSAQAQSPAATPDNSMFVPVPAVQAEAQADAAPAPAATALPSGPTAIPTAVPAETETPEEQPQEASDAYEGEPVGYFGNIFADKFTDGEVEKTADSYKSRNLNIQIHKLEFDRANVFVAEIFVRDITNFVTAFGQNQYGMGISWSVEKIAGSNEAILGINGDYYGVRNTGLVLRNGTLYRSDDNSGRDICVVYWDGTMETYAPGEYDEEEELRKGAYHAWCFGPMLLDRSGNTMTSFNTEFTSRDPRTALGYIEPGHYLFIVVDGRSSDSKGLTITKMSELCYQLGCVRAYNLDGGQSSQMIFDGQIVNDPYKGGRNTSDMLLIKDLNT